MMKFTIWVSPVTKKNHQRILRNKKTGARFIAPSEQYEKYEQDAAPFVPKTHITHGVNVKALFYMPTHRRVDLTNLNEALHDVLVKHGCLEDDNSKVIVSTDGSRVLYSKKIPRTEVEITEV